MKVKKIIIFVSLIVIAILIFFFVKNNYKKFNIGNNITSKSIKEVENYILNINSYKAKIEVEVQSNKNENKYILMQKFAKPNISKQEVLEPSNVKGIETIYNGKDLTINNSNLGLSSIYENYQYMIDNCLWINSFIEDYKECNEDEKAIREENDEIVMETKVRKESKYIKYKKLYIDSKTYKPSKMLIQDVNKKTLVYISYKEIEIDSLSKEEVLAYAVENI